MSYEEKGIWVYLGALVVAYGAYVGTILWRARDVPLVEVRYVAAMLGTIGLAVALTVVGRIVIAVLNPAEAEQADVRDREIFRHGEFATGMVVSVGMLLPLGLVMAELAHFWVANAMFLVYVTSALTGTLVKLAAYRRGF